MPKPAEPTPAPSSDSQGIFHLWHLEPGIWFVAIEDSGERGLPEDQRVIFNGRQRQSCPIRIEEGKEASVDFDFPAVVVVRGRVVGPDGSRSRPNG